MPEFSVLPGHPSQGASAVQGVQTAAAKLTAAPLAAVLKPLEPVDKAKTHAVYAYAIAALSYAALRMQGVGTKEHPVSDELSRVKEYFGRIKEAGVQDQATGAARPASVDKAAASRLVKGSLGSQRTTGRTAGGEGRGKAEPRSKGRDGRRGTKRQRNETEKQAPVQDASERQFSKSRRSQAGVIGEAAETAASRKSGTSALGVAPKRTHLNWNEGLKARKKSKHKSPRK